MAENNKIDKILENYKEETKRHFDVVTEGIKDEINIVSEQVGANTEKLDTLSEQVGANTEKLDTLSEQVGANTEKLEEHDQRFNKIDENIEIIKLDIEFIKNGLKQKVPRDEFAVLERRVSLLEAKLKG